MTPVPFLFLLGSFFSIWGTRSSNCLFCWAFSLSHYPRPLLRYNPLRLSDIKKNHNKNIAGRCGSAHDGHYSRHLVHRYETPLYSSSSSLDDDSKDSEVERLREQAARLRKQIREMEDSLLVGDAIGRRKRSYSDDDVSPEKSLVGKRILVAGANGRLGSMICRYLLRNNPSTQVVAAVHVVGENSPTSRGYGRLSYEVGAEDGVGFVRPAWSLDDDDDDAPSLAVEWNPETRRDANLPNLRVVECELLNPVQCRSVVEGCDSVIWCATDFDGNVPRSISGWNIAFLFRAVMSPDKGRVEIEGLENMLGALKQERQESWQRKGRKSPPLNDPINFILISSAPEALGDFETPTGSFIGLKRQGEQIVKEDYPSLTWTVLQMGRYEDNFVGEDRPVLMQDEKVDEGTVRLINRRDAARAAVDALTRDDLVGKVVQVWTETKK